MFKTHRLAAFLLLFTGACADVENHDDHDDHDHHDHNHGLTTTLVVSFTPAGGGEPLSFVWTDPENDGSPVVDSIVLPDASDDGPHEALSYQVEVEVWNELEDPAEDVTPDIADLAEEHQFFFTGSAIDGPATGASPNAILEHSYADEDADGLPLGLENDMATAALGSGELIVTLRHLPFENDQPTKTEGMAEDVATGGFGAIAGDIDIQATFPIEVQ